MAEKGGLKGMFNASERDGVQYRKAKLWEMILGNANNGCGICFYLLMMYASYIASEGYGIATAVAGMIITGTRLFDGATDALAAAIYEKFPAKHGKVRIFLIVGWVLASLGVFTMYNWASGKFSGAAGIAVFIFAYVLYVLGYTINGVSGGTVATIITNDPTQRPMNGFISTMYSYITPMVFNTIIAFLILPKYDNKYNAPMLKEACFLYAAVALFFVIVACIGLKNVDVEATFEALSANKKDEKESKITFKDMVHVFSENKETRMYILTGVSDKFAQQVGSQSIIGTMLNGILIGSYMMSTLVGNFGMIVGLFFAFAGGVYVAKNGAKKSTTVWSWAAIILSVINFLFFCYLGIDGMKSVGEMGPQVIFFAIIATLITGVKMILTTTSTAMRADIVDYELERSGKYMPAVIGGVYSFIDKLVTSVCSTVAAVCVAFIGYKNTVPQMGDKATPAIFWMTMALYFGLPVIGWICNIIAMHYYSLDKERMVEVAKNIAAKKQEAMES